MLRVPFFKVTTCTVNGATHTRCHFNAVLAVRAWMEPLTLVFLVFSYLLPSTIVQSPTVHAVCSCFYSTQGRAEDGAN